MSIDVDVYKRGAEVAGELAIAQSVATVGEAADFLRGVLALVDVEPSDEAHTIVAAITLDAELDPPVRQDSSDA